MTTRPEPSPFAANTEHFNHVSFSFDNMRIEQAEPRKTIDQYLRLKTNESIQEKSNQVAKRSVCYRKSMRGSEAELDSEYQMQLRNDEQLLRMESLTKQYELKLAKQEEFFSLREWKLKEQVDNLTHQNGSLNEEVRRLKASNKQQTSHCSLCSDGQVINHLKTVLKEAEESHRHCLEEKKEMSQKIVEGRGKLQVVEEEGERLYQQYKNLNKQVRTSNNQIHTLEQEINQLKQMNNTLRETASRKQSDWSSQQVSLEQSIGQLKRKITYLQRRQQQSMKNGKTTTKSVLSSVENSMNSSFMKQKQSSAPKQQRISLSKIPHQQCEDRTNIENYLFMRRMSDHPRASVKAHDQKLSNKQQNIDWKLF